MHDTVTVNISADYGSLILGGLLAFGLSGCVNMQFIVYWQVYPEFERWTTKSLVIATWLLDLCHSAFIAVAIWDSVIAPYGNLRTIDVIPWSVGPTVELTAMTTFLVQNFFAYRIYRLQKNKVTVAGPVFILAFIRLVAASVSLAEMIRLKEYSNFGRPFPSWVFTLGLSLSAFVDIVITLSLCYFLRSNRSALQKSSTNRIIDLLTVWTVQNGFATCFGAITTLICWLAMPQNRVFLGLHFVVGKLYANSLLATLNARIKIRKSQHRYVTPNQLHPIAMLPGHGSAEGDEEYGPESPMSQRPYPMRVDQLALQPVNIKHAKSKIEVSVSQTVESKYDREVDMDVMTITAESVREEEGLQEM